MPELTRGGLGVSDVSEQSWDAFGPGLGGEEGGSAEEQAAQAEVQAALVEAALKRLVRVDPARLRRLFLGVILAYGALGLLGLAGMALATKTGRGIEALAGGAGLAVGVMVGLSWVLGALLGSNQSRRVYMGVTLGLSPLRYLGALGALFGLAAHFDDPDMTALLVLSFVATQIVNHIIEARLLSALADAELPPDALAPAEAP